MNITQETNNWDNTYSTSAIGDYASTNDLKYSKLEIKDICPQPIGYLRHNATNTNISVYKKIGKFQRWCIKKCFGLEYIEL